MSRRSTVDLYFLFEEKIKIRGFPDFTLIMLFASYWSALHFQNQLATIFHTHADWNVLVFFLVLFTNIHSATAVIYKLLSVAFAEIAVVFVAPPDVLHNLGQT